jgi:malate synthase
MMASRRKSKKARPEKKKGAAAKAAAPKRGKGKQAAKKQVAKKQVAKKPVAKKKAASRKTSTASKRTRKAAASKPRAKATAAGARKRATKKPARASQPRTNAKARSPAARSGAKSTVAARKGASAGAAKPSAAKPRTAKPGAASRNPSGSARGRSGFIETARRAVRSAGRGILRTVAPAAGRTARSARRSAQTAVRAPSRSTGVSGVAIKGQMGPRYDEILNQDALAFLANLHRRFNDRRKELLGLRTEQQARYDAGALPDFLPSTRHIREDDWKVAPIPNDLLDRRVEITGPVDRKMVINALNCGANVYMADFEDANSPTWANNVEGQINMKDRWGGALDFVDATTGREYRLNEQTAVLIVRPRGWHLEEDHLTVDGEPISGALFDFGLYFFHNARKLLDRGTRPYFYLPKLETHLEARLWNEVFVYAQELFGLPTGLIKATVLIETLPAAFEMDEILWELRNHAAGLNAGRWDYIFSFIKKLAKNPDYVLPDRSQVVMGKAFLRAYALLLIRTCHRRGAFAMGGMAAQIPVRNNPKVNDEAFARVRADKEREANDGHDGTWVAHPDLVPVAKEVFDRLMPHPNQLDRLRTDVHVTRDELLRVHEGARTEEGFRHNIRVGVQYIEAWLRGRGAVPIYNLMEDAATAEISRAQIWQWIKYGVVFDTGITATADFFERALGEEMARVKTEIGAANYAEGRFPEAIKLFSTLSLAPEFEDFLTIPAYRLIA